MPELTQLDATQTLPALNHVSDLIDQYRRTTEQYAEHIMETTALRGVAREALAHNAEQIAAAGLRAHAAVSGRINGLRQVAEHGAKYAAQAARHIDSVEIPDHI